MSAPVFSIIITTVDRPLLLTEAVDSVLRQSVTDFELIIVNDGGPDLTDHLGNRDPRIKLLRLPGRSGPGRARNQGVAMARGRYIGFLDDDDLFHPDHLATLLEGLNRNPEAVVYADAEVFHEKVEHGVRRIIDRARPWKHSLFIKQRLWIQNFIPVQSFVVAREAFQEVGGFDEQLRAFEDWELLLKLAVGHEFIHIEKLTSEIRMRPAEGKHRSQSVKSDRSEPEIIESIYARYGDLNDPLVRAGRDFLRNNNFSTGPDFLTVDTNDAGLAYQAWLGRNPSIDTPADSTGNSILFIVLCKPAQQRWDSATLAAFARMSDPAHRMVLVNSDDESTDDPRISLDKLATPDDWTLQTQTINEAIARHHCDWVAILPGGATFDAGIAAQLAAINAPFAYTDHDLIIHPQGIRSAPRFKPDFNRDLLAATDYIGPAIFVRRKHVLEAGGVRPYPGLWLQELLWRTATAKEIGHIAWPLVHLPAGYAEHPLKGTARQALVEQHVASRTPGTRVEPGPVPDTLRLAFPIPRPFPRVSLIVSAANGDGNWDACLSSLLQATNYPQFEILVAAADAPPLAPWQAQANSRGVELRAATPTPWLNTSAARNKAAEEAVGEILVFLDNGVEAILPAWLEMMVGQAMRPEIGAIGGRLIGPDGRTTGGGLILGIKKGIGIAFEGEAYALPGYMNRARLQQNLSAIDGRCLAISAARFKQLGGFSALRFPERHADVDLCLRLTDHGWNIGWEPDILFANRTPNPIPPLSPELLDTWGHRLAMDPAYNQNLSRESANFLPAPG